MNFGDALEAVKTGKRAAREGWNGKGMFVFLNKGSVDPGGNIPNLSVDIDKTLIQGIDSSMFENGATGTSTRMPNLNLNTVHGSTITGWAASQTDMLASDWYIVE